MRIGRHALAAGAAAKRPGEVAFPAARATPLRLAWILAAALMAGCAAPPKALVPSAELFADARFAPPSQTIDATAPLAADDAMRRYVRTDMNLSIRQEGREWALVHALHRRPGLRLEYDSQITRTASEAFAARAGNCLSLAIMTAALAREMGLQATFQTAVSGDIWSRSGDLYLASGHVNVVIGQPTIDIAGRSTRSDLVIDFVPVEQARGLKMRPISQATVIAMFMNNRAAEAMLQGHLDDAYWWARAAVLQEPAHRNAYNTLGVVYQRHGDTVLAERAFRAVLEQMPDNFEAMSNLVQLYRRTGQDEQAAALQSTLERIAPHPPFHFFELGRQAMARGDYAQARDLFERELRRDDSYHEFHFWLALAELRLGHAEAAREHLQLAQRYSPEGNEKSLYNAKLAALREGRLGH